MKAAETADLIDQLTTDNDERQELWLHYLQNSDTSAFTTYLSKIRRTFSEDQLLQVTIWKRARTAPEFGLLQLFAHFTDLEQSVMQLLALGATIEEIGTIKNTSVARIRHVVSIIRENDAWKELNGSKDTLNG